MEPRRAGPSAPPSLLLAALTSLLLVASSDVRAETVNLAASKDTTIFSESGTLSNGAGSWFFAGETNDATLRRALIAFDIAAAIPSGSTISSVTLTLYLSRTRTGNTGVALHRVNSAWGEAGSDADAREGTGAPAEAGDATWSHRIYPTSTWATPGGDIVNPASATTMVGAQDAYYTWTSNQMKLDVQAWLGTPASNNGWIVIGDEDELKVAKRFDSRQNPDAATRPKLTVTFTPPASSGACCATDGTCSVVLHPGSSCTGSYQGSGVSCSPNPCPQPTGACCLPVAAATCVEVTEAECEEDDGMFLSAPADCSSAHCPVVLEPFEDALPRPLPATPASGVAGGAATYNLAIREFSQKLHEDLPPTRVWGFGDGPTGGGYPGPTIEATSGIPITVHWINDLRDAGGALRTEHYLPVDHCPHGAHTAAARTVIHLHGGHVPASVDGYPEATFLPGQQVTYEYPNNQPAGTLWYHDHALGITRLNVYMGMGGFYLVRDPGETALGLPSGEYEVPLAIQDRSFHPDGSLLYPEMWQEHFFGDTILVNGKVWPYLEVKRGKYRFRMLNGSTSRTYRLTLSNGAPFRQIGTDGGLLPAPVTINTITIGPGERADVVIDFAGFTAGTEIVLTNSAPTPYPSGDPGQHAVIPNVMQFKVLAATGHTAALPGALRPVVPIDEGESVIERDLELRKGDEECSGTAWFINGLRWDDITEYPELGTVEVWRFINRSGVMHPMHMHLVFFQVLDRQAFTESGDDIVLVGNPVPPPAEEAGWKDTVQVGPNEVVRVIARFEDYKGKYPYHCHILEHEDHEMMRQFQTVSCGDGEVDEGEQCDQGVANGTAGSCCTADCTLVASSTQCRASTGECDPAEICNGGNPLCPPDIVHPAGLACTPDADVCTDDECDGAGLCVHTFDITNDPLCEPTTTTTTLAETTCGDANGDGNVTAGDALIALRTGVGTSACPVCVCDVNSSGAVLAGDALLILRAAVGQAVELVCVGC
ncbi:MAG: multicopper oxidase domain-containing protein [Candidatus Binatia bacterium]